MPAEDRNIPAERNDRLATLNPTVEPLDAPLCDVEIRPPQRPAAPMTSPVGGAPAPTRGAGVDSPDAGGERVPEFPNGVVLTKDQAVNYLAREAARHVYEHIEKRETRWRWVLTTLFTVVGLAGYQVFSRLITSAVTDATKDIPTQITTGVAASEARLQSSIAGSVNTILDSQIGALRSSMESEMAFLALSRLSVELDEREESFTNLERDAAMEQLKTIVRSPDVRARAEFMSALQKLVKAFDSASLSVQIDQIDDIAGSQMTRDPALVGSLVTHYGNRLLGTGASPSDWDQDVKQRFDRYAQAATQLRLPEFARTHVVLAAFASANRARSDTVVSHLRETSYWTADEQAHFHFALLLLSRAEFYLRPGSQSFQADNLAQLVEAFRIEYAPELHGLLRNEEVAGALQARARIPLIRGNSAFSKAIDSAIDAARGG